MALPRFQDNQRYLVEGKTLNEIFEAIQTAQIRKGPGYDLRVVPGEGTTLKIEPGGAGSVPWDLVATETGWRVEPGQIFASYGDLASAMTLESSGMTFTPAGGGHVYIEMSDLPEVKLTLKYGNDWSGYPQTYEISSPSSLPYVTRAFVPLWSFATGTLPAGVPGRQVGDNVYGQRWSRAYHLVLTWGSHEVDPDGLHVPVPILAPL